jgi:hypothetical protein
VIDLRIGRYRHPCSVMCTQRVRGRQRLYIIDEEPGRDSRTRIRRLIWAAKLKSSSEEKGSPGLLIAARECEVLNSLLEPSYLSSIVISLITLAWRVVMFTPFVGLEFAKDSLETLGEISNKEGVHVTLKTIVRYF